MISQKPSQRSPQFDVEALKRLIEHDGWTAFKNSIEYWLEDEYMSIVTYTKYEDFLCAKERIKILRQIMDHPSVLIERHGS